MTVYIEYVIIDNMVMNGLIIFFTLKVMRLKISKLKIPFVAILGTAIAILLPLVNLPSFAIIIFKVITGFLLTVFISKYKNFLEYVKATGMFFLFTFVMGGACFGILYLLTGNIEKAITMGYEKVPVGIIIGVPFAMIILLNWAVKRIKKNRHKAPFYYNVKLYLNGSNVEIRGYMDSGNLLYDGHGNPVVVANYDAIGALIADNLLTGKKTKMENICFKTVSGTSEMKVFRPDKIEVYSDKSVNILYDVRVGLTDRKFDDYSCLLHPACIS